MAAIATYLSYEENYKILLINAKYNDTSLQECFFEQERVNVPKNDLETGIGGLIKAISSNKTSPEIITNYTRTIFKNRLEILTDNNIPKDKFENQKEYMRSIIKMASKYYDLVFVDIEGSLEDPYIQGVLQESNLIIANTSQRMKMIDEFFKLSKNCEAIKSYNVIFLIGKYDRYSKYNDKNLKRVRRIQDIFGIPYNTLFFEYSNEGNMAEFIVNNRKVKQNSVQAPIMEAIISVSKRIIEKLKEIQMQV